MIRIYESRNILKYGSTTIRKYVSVVSVVSGQSVFVYFVIFVVHKNIRVIGVIRSFCGFSDFCGCL